MSTVDNNSMLVMLIAAYLHEVSELIFQRSVWPMGVNIRLVQEMTQALIERWVPGAKRLPESDKREIQEKIDDLVCSIVMQGYLEFSIKM